MPNLVVENNCDGTPKAIGLKEKDADLIRYRLSPLQEGMLIHSLADQGVGMYVSQVVYVYRKIDVAALQEAWRLAVQRHEVLRTSFIWEGVPRPLQAINPQVEVKFKISDLCHLNEWQQRLEVRGLLAEDRKLGFDLTRPPLFRLLLIQTGRDSYYLIFSHHHLLLDGWSNPIVINDVREFYNGVLSGVDVKLAAARPFRDYIAWLESQPQDAEKAFWRSYLEDFVQATPLPYDLGVQRQAGHALESAEWPTEVSGSQYQRLKEAARTCRVTINTIIQAAWALLLSRYSGRSKVVFGSLVSGRSSPAALPGIESMVGMFLNTLPMLVVIDNEAPVRGWLESVQRQQSILNDHEISSLMEIQKWSEVSPGSPLFESVINTNNMNQPSSEDIRGQRDDVVMAPVNQSIPLLLFVIPKFDRLDIILIFNSRRFTRVCMSQLANQLVTLLSSISDGTEKRVGELDIASAEERQRALIAWNQTEVAYPRSLALHQLFERHAAARPDAPAVHFLDQTYSYGALNAKANMLAHHLAGIGIGRGHLVAFCLDRSLDMAVTLMAILKSGAAYVPLDPNYPLSRLELMLQSSRPSALISETKWAGQFRDMVAQVICFDTEADNWANRSRSNLELPLTPEDLAYVLYTSGSTGVPKGIMIPHRVPVNRMFIESEPFSQDEALCAKTSICFVDSGWELWSAWSNGLAVTLISDGEVKDPQKLVDALARSGSTRLVLVPSLLRSMLDNVPELAARLPRMRHWICSGEALPGDLSARFVASIPNGVLTNLYGATEIWDATRCDTTEDLPYEPMSIGRTMGNMQGYVLDEAMQPVPVGIVGEMYFSGEHIAHGYWNKPKLTAQAFLPNPFSASPGSRMYKTGDLGRWLPDGNFEYLGRIDQQVQLRGLRIELEEIESVIRMHPGVEQAAVVVSEDQRLVAFIVGNGKTIPAAAELRKHVRQRLPEHMTPAFYLRLESIPLTPNGKTDRRALPKPEAAELARIIEGAADSRPPTTETELAVAAVWARMLGLGDVGAESDFFQLGGESLMAVRIITELGKRYGLSIPFSVLMNARTVADMARWIDQRLASGALEAKPSSPELTKIDYGRKAPLSEAQLQMWLIDQLNPGSLSYTVPCIVRFAQAVNRDALNTALSQLIVRHETLRTTFSSIDGEPFQVINEPEPITIPFDDLSESPEEMREDLVVRALREQTRIPWNLEQGPLFRYRLIKRDPETYLLAMALHHIATDGRSMAILSYEIRELYQASVERRPARLQPLPIQYADYAIWQREWLRGERILPHLEYWEAKLVDASVLQLPSDYPRPAVNRFRGAQTSVRLNDRVLRGLRGIANAEGATMFMVLLAAFQLLLARHSGQDDICVGTPTENRSQPHVDRLIGYFVNTIVIRTKVHGEHSFRELLRLVRRTCLEAYDHQEVPFQRLVDRLGVRRELGNNPLFQVLFVHQRVDDEKEHTKAFTRVVSPEQETANFDLVLNVQERSNGLECKFIFNADMFSRPAIERMGGHFRRIIRYAVRWPDRHLYNLPLLLPRERRQILGEFKGSPRQGFEGRCAHEVIAQQAILRPGQVAIRRGDEALTYAELERRSNSVACQLRELGVGAESILGWCGERSLQTFVGLLGIMKSGAAFLPIDPSLPAPRLAYLLQDAGVSLVVTERHLAERVPKGCRCFILDKEAQGEVEAPTTRSAVKINPNQLAYVIYTSGSTGNPKGVMVQHKNLANVVRAQIPLFKLDPDSHVLQTLSLSFDAALGEIFRTLVAGATLHLVSEDAALPGLGLINQLKAEKISSMTLSAAALTALPRVSEQLSDLKSLTVGGDSVDVEVANHWRQNRHFMNGYGPTETTIGATLACSWDERARPALGRPLRNVEVYVLDPWMRPVPVGTPGELYIGGVGVSRGYLRRPRQTAAAFVPHPFTENPGERLYRTGDLVRWLSDGQLYFLGRLDHQVKIRGYRVELTEIEAVLRRHQDVHNAAVILHRRDGSGRLAGYITPTAGGKANVEQLRRYLRGSLPDYMVPAYLILCDTLPMTASGKIDRKALPAPEATQVQLEGNDVAPRTDTERLIASIWEDVLGLDKVGVESNYFDLGGDSITSIRVVARLNEKGYAISPQQIFRYQTVAELAASLAAAQEESRKP